MRGFYAATLLPIKEAGQRQRIIVGRSEIRIGCRCRYHRAFIRLASCKRDGDEKDDCNGSDGTQVAVGDGHLAVSIAKGFTHETLIVGAILHDHL